MKAALAVLCLLLVLGTNGIPLRRFSPLAIKLQISNRLKSSTCRPVRREVDGSRVVANTTFGGEPLVLPPVIQRILLLASVLPSLPMLLTNSPSNDQVRLGEGRKRTECLALTELGAQQGARTSRREHSAQTRIPNLSPPPELVGVRDESDRVESDATSSAACYKQPDERPADEHAARVRVRADEWSGCSCCR